SGLTAAAWQRGGVSLAHYSGAQYQETMRIGAGDLQPGDLVFYGPGGSNHVEIYIGGGMVVSASNPSSGVKLAGVRYGSASGYGRVRG
ncbi:MAG: NlpC/P60 family protein, partial [Acidimicrobiia bacterium]